MPLYTTRGDNPPAAIAIVTLLSVDGSVHVDDIPMLLDTGADASVVPLEAVTRLGLSFLPNRSLEIESYDGTKNKINLVQMSMKFCAKRFRGPFLVLDQPMGIIGRDVLNRLNLNFNGPLLTWDSLPL